MIGTTVVAVIVVVVALATVICCLRQNGNLLLLICCNICLIAGNHSNLYRSPKYDKLENYEIRQVE